MGLSVVERPYADTRFDDAVAWILGSMISLVTVFLLFVAL